MGAPAARVQVIVCPAATQPAGIAPGVRPSPSVSNCTSPAVVPALATVTVSVEVSVSPSDTPVRSPTSTDLSTVITGSTGFCVVQVPQAPLPGTTLLPTEVSASAST